MLDQLSAKWLEAARDGICPTPNIDWLAAQGTVFTQAVSSNPVCCPARATLATGLTSRQHGVLENGYELDPALPTYMRLLQGAGWKTGCFGKLHLHPHFAGLRPDYRCYGFDEIHITEDPRGGEWLDWVEAEHPEHYEAALATIWPTAIPEFAAYGHDKRDLRSRIEAVRRDFDWTSPQVPDGDWGHYALPFPEAVSQTAWITGHAVRFIEAADRETPLHCHISYVQPHSPFCAPGHCFDVVDVDSIPAPLEPAWGEDPHHPRSWDGPGSHWARRTVPEDWQSRRHCYFADIHHLDAQLGRVREALAAAGRLESACFVLLADHGDMLLDHGMSGKGNMHYDACVRVPLLLAGPGLQQGATCDALVQLEDLFPTVLEWAGLESPALPSMGPYLQGEVGYLAGRSLLPWCRGEPPEAWRDCAYAESYNNITAATPDHWARTVRTARHRYTWFPRGTGEQLFDLAADPHEQRNLVGEAAAQGVRAELRERLFQAVVLQDHPHPARSLFAIGVH